MGADSGADRPTAAVQDYLKAIYRVEEDTGRSVISTSELASALAVSAPSASAMLKRLGGLGYVTATDRRGSFTLTAEGRGAALEVIRHHRLLETFLVTRLGMPIEEVHREAEVLEHHISEALEARIAEELGHPERDPHGAPIPTIGGQIAPVPATTLAELDVGVEATVRRLGEEDPDLLRDLQAKGVLPDCRVVVVGRDSHGALTLRFDGGDTVDVSHAAAEVVRVSPGA